MRILFVSTVYPSAHLPTMGTFNRVLMEALRAQGHEVRTLVPVPWTQAGGHSRTVDGHDLTFRWWYLPVIDRGRMHKGLSRQLKGFWRRCRGEWSPEIVVGYWVDPDGSAALDLADELGVPGALLIGGTDINELARSSGRGATIRTTLKRARVVLTIGNALADAVIDLGIPGSKVHPFHRGVDKRRFFPGNRDTSRQKLLLPATDPILLWVGRMVTVKGLDTLVDALALVRHRPAPHLYLLGGGPLEAKIRRQAVRLGLIGQVHFIGRVSHEALPDWYRAANLVVLPSRSEGVPNVLLESLACGTPFVASDVGGIGELAESADWLAAPNNPKEHADRIDAMLGSQPQVLRSRTDDRDAARVFSDVLAETVASFALEAGHPSG